jgi:hypothetical protein
MTTGLRTAVFVIAALVTGFALSRSYYEFAGLGALFLSNTEGPHSRIPASILLIACLAESFAWGAGTLVATTGNLVVILVGVGVFIITYLTQDPNWTTSGIFIAVSFDVAAGIPGGSPSEVPPRVLFSLLGALFAYAGVLLQREIVRLEPQAVGSSNPTIQTNSDVVPVNGKVEAVLLGIASSVGLGIGVLFGLPRDYWIVVTIVLLFRRSFGSRIAMVSMLLGTMAGAVIAALIVLTTTNLDLLFVLLFVDSIFLFSVRGMNLGLVQVFVVPFIVILVNILFHGQWQLAIDRVIDVAIGGVTALAATSILRLRSRTTWTRPFR